MELLGLLGLVNLFLSFVAGWIARNKGRSAIGYFLFSFFLTFLLAVLVLIAVPPLKPVTTSQTRECPFCKESILNHALVCKHCGRDVEPVQSAPFVSDVEMAASYKSNKWLNLGGIFMLAGALLIWVWWSGRSEDIPIYGRVIILCVEVAVFVFGAFLYAKGIREQNKAKRD
ncbi:MAG: hypothetical protein RLZ82_95 [Actinomycetota bacterium]|jgi:ribosomal protein L32